MSRTLMIVLLSSALAFGGMSTRAWSAADVSVGQTAQTVDAKNQAPLPPAGPAGIKQAQGFFEDNRLLTLALIGAVLVGIWILLEDDDDDEVPSTTGT